MIIHDLRCKHCGNIAINVPCVRRPDGAFPVCPRCGGERTWIPAKLNTDIWGSGQYVTSLDREFGSKSELKSYLRENGLQEAGDRVGGARNASHLGLGKVYSYSGQKSRKTAAENAGRRNRAST